MTNYGIIEDLRLVPAPTIWDHPLTWIALAAAAVAGIFFFRRWLQSRPIPLKLPKPEPTGPLAHVTALARLQELRARHEKLSAYDVALECSDILRRYIEARFQMAIRYQTTREFLGLAQTNAELSAASRAELGNFLEFFDGIKFAQEKARPEQTIEAIDGAERFVRRSIPAEVAPS